MHDAAAELRRAGYLVLGQPHDLDGRWSLTAYSAASEIPDDGLTKLAEIAERCGVEFDEWGASVGRSERGDRQRMPPVRTKSSNESLSSTRADISVEPIMEYHLTGHTSCVNDVVVVELDGRPAVVSASSDATVRVWDLATGFPIGTPNHGHTGPVYWVATAQLDGRPVVVSAGVDKTVRMLDPATGHPIGTPITDPDDANLKGNSTMATAQLDGRPVVVSAGVDKTVRMYDLATGHRIGRPFNTPSYINAMATMQLYGRLVVIGGAAERPMGGPSPMVTVWDFITGYPIGSPFTDHTDTISAIAIIELSGRQMVISGSYDKTIRVWDPATGKAVGSSFTDHTREISAIATIQLNGRPMVISGSYDNTVRVWDPASGKAVGSPFDDHTFPVSAVATTQLDGRPVVISGDSYNKTVRVWDLAARTR